MTRKQTTLAVVAAAVLLLFTTGLRADSHGSGSKLNAGVVISSHGGIGVWIGKPAPTPPPHRFPPHREVVVHKPWPYHHRHVYGRPPVVIMPPPAPRPVIIHPAPPVVEREVVVWIVNSNGSKSSVKLIQRGSQYIGPRGEYYDEMPTNEQLRVVYGF